ncbi:hypothetical protein JXB28_06025 [Candidatus Woesearchaeota archaeon]|nr:hypothetical protein [Candidatus Woesearchaeota archaeon]
MKTIIISTFAEDRIITDSGMKKRDGGPALFIKNFFDKAGLEYELISGEKAIVEIDMRNKKEIGKIKQVASIQYDPDKVKDSGLVLVSTLLKEFPLKAYGAFPCVDIQGYVRSATGFGKKKYFDSPELEKFAIIKGTENELRYVPISRMKGKNIVIKTKGAQGFDVISGGKEKYFTAKKVKSPNTIGAGDTFFAAFCTHYYKTRDIDRSALYAKEKVCEFLMQKSD